MIEIRAPSRDEKEAWLPLWQGYLTFYESNLMSDVTDTTWERFHDPAEPLHLLAAYEGGTMVGFAAYLFHRSTWAKHHYCYLEDLFVAEGQRGKGIARKLIETLTAVARRENCSRLYWGTREGNKTAQTLYDQLAEKTDFLEYRIKLT
jgi:GNAT superfamily N-acetyltransferase